MAAYSASRCARPAGRILAWVALGAALAFLPGGMAGSLRGSQAWASAADDDRDEGVRFTCADQAALGSLGLQVDAYLEQAGIRRVRVRQRAHALVFTLDTPPHDTSTLDFAQRRDLAVGEAIVSLPVGRGRLRDVRTVSTKEILLALLQHGRLTDFPCTVEALREQVGVRQNIVAWAERIDWVWPDGDSALWNPRYWRNGTPRAGHPLHEAVNDAFVHPDRYRIGCYTATKLVLLQGVLDYYRRVRPDPAKLARIEARLLADGEPLVDVEPGAMWYFEDDHTPDEERRPGKLVALQRDVAPGNFVPGDWLYLLNTDAGSRGKTGYEGSNAIYLGRDRFDDYYNDNGHGYSFREKLSEVYQWRHGVFSRSRDAAKIEPLHDDDYRRLAQPPEAGGLLESYRAVVAGLDGASGPVEF